MVSAPSPAPRGSSRHAVSEAGWYTALMVTGTRARLLVLRVVLPGFSEASTLSLLRRRFHCTPAISKATTTAITTATSTQGGPALAALLLDASAGLAATSVVVVAASVEVDAPGDPVGGEVGVSDGLDVAGEAEGDTVGELVGDEDGAAVVGDTVGDAFGSEVVGNSDGDCVVGSDVVGAVVGS